MSTQVSSAAHPKQEASDLQPKAVVLSAIGIVLMVLLVAVVSRLLTGPAGVRQPVPAGATATGSLYLTANPTDEIARYQEEKRAQLETYGWVDGQRFAHIPIERAMQKLAAEHAAAGKPQ